MLSTRLWCRQGFVHHKRACVASLSVHGGCALPQSRCVFLRCTSADKACTKVVAAACANSSRTFGTFTAPAGEMGYGGRFIKGVTRLTSARHETCIDGGPISLDLGGTVRHRARYLCVTLRAQPAPLTRCGAQLDEVTVSWEEWGDKALPPSRTIFIVPSFSNSAHVIRNLGDPSPGWWEGMVGPGCYIDTDHFRVICASNIGPLSPVPCCALARVCGRCVAVAHTCAAA